MARIPYRIPIVTRQLDGGVFVAEAPLLPETAFVEGTAARAREAARILAKRKLENRLEDGKLPVPLPEDFQTVSLEVEMEPPVRGPAWKHPVHLRFDVLRWTHGEVMAVAYVPALGIAVLAEKPELLEERVVSHIRFALFRSERAKSLRELVPIQRAEGLGRDLFSVNLNYLTPRRRQEHREREDDRRLEMMPTLRAAADDLTSAALPKIHEAGRLVRRVAEALTGRRGGSVLLVGPSGAGKTAAVHDLVRQRALHGLGGRPFYATSGSRLVAGMSGYGMWQERLRDICREAARTGAILHVGGLLELMEVGKSIYNPLGMASFLRPYLSRGDLRVIAECTPEEVPAIERREPHLLQIFHRVEIEEPDEERGREILLSVAADLSPRRRAAVTEDGLDLLDRLHRRFATSSAYPGRPIRFLTNLIKDAGRERTAAGPREVLAAFSRETGIPPVILDETEPLDLAAVREWFESRVLGQPEAVRRVADLLAVVKTRLARPRKPLASLLFAGPTGVGKTEMAKALAEFVFKDRDRLVRFDMSEYSDPEGAGRLIGGTEEGEGRLTSRVREQPFSVVLLDEFEKAHPAAFDLLLQVLGEGRLSDQAGRVADFRNAVIIMTSNLGAASYGRGPAGFSGREDVRAGARDHFTAEVRRFLRPEMFNRLDAIVPFSPLDRDTVLRIARRELSLISRRDGLLFRKVALRIDDGVAAFLAEKGFEPHYGARPLKRTAEERLVTPLAERLNSYTDELPLAGEVTADHGGLNVKIGADPDAGRNESDAVRARTVRGLAGEISRFRRRARKLRATPDMTEVENDVFRLSRLEVGARRRLISRGIPPPAELQPLPGMRKILAEVKSLEERAEELEDRFLFDFYRKEKISVPSRTAELDSLREELDRLLLRLLARRFEDPDRAVLAVFSEHARRLFQLAGGYFRFIIAAVAGARVSARKVSVSHSAAAGGRTAVLTEIENLAGFLAETDEGAIGLVLEIRGEMVYPLLQEEQWLHTFKEKNRTEKCLVQVVEGGSGEYSLPPGIEQPKSLKKFQSFRTYNCDLKQVNDRGERAVKFHPDRLENLFRALLPGRLLDRARKIVGEEEGP